MSFTTTEPPFRFRRGTRPLLISMPHVGTHVPSQLAARLTDEARPLLERRLAKRPNPGHYWTELAAAGPRA